MKAIREIRPQPGPQAMALACWADILIYGGAAGAGKSWFLIADPLRNLKNGAFKGIAFRRTSPMLTNPGGLWDESSSLYPLLGGEPSSLRWKFPSGMTLKFGHLVHEKTKFDHQGAQYAWIGFDELTHFTESQFFYLLSRNRSVSGVPGRIRATCNPDPDSWVRTFIDWWIDKSTGLPIPERIGGVRFFVRDGDKIVWGDTRAELAAKYDPAKYPPKSVSFIPGTIHDNRILMEKDPTYLANLMALPLVERSRLLGGNWNIRAAAGLYFKRHYFKVVDSPTRPATIVRYWDLAGTEATKGKDPDYTVGLKVSVDSEGVYTVEDMVRFRESPLMVERALRNTATQDSDFTLIGIGRDPGQAGKFEVAHLVRKLAGFTVRGIKEVGDKTMRAGPPSAQAEAGNIRVVRGDWNEDFFRELESFPTKGVHDDIVDALSGAFTMLTTVARGGHGGGGPGIG